MKEGMNREKVSLVVLVPLVREVFGSTGSSLLTACVLLGMMILPTIITVSESALNAVPSSYYEGALALGATHERSVFHVRYFGAPGQKSNRRW